MSLSSRFSETISPFRLFFFGALLILCTQLSAQQPKVLAPKKHMPTPLTTRMPWGIPTVPQTATGGLWMTDAKWKSSLYLRNVLKTDPITVTPVIYLSNGKRYPLAAVTLQPSGNAIVDIGDGLQSVGIAPYATLCGYVEIDYQWPWEAVMATVKNVDVVNSLIFIFPLGPSPDWQPKHPESMPVTQPASFEGMWWKQEKNVSGFLGLSNVTGKAINATVQLTGDANQQLGRFQVTVSPHGTKIVALDQLATVADTAGGVYVTHDGPERGLDINGGLEDLAVGYSARLRTLPQLQPSSTSQTNAMSFSQLGLMTGAADPMMNLPSGTVFSPYSVVRNISDQPGLLTPELWWMSGGSPQSVRLPQMAVPPHQTLNLNVSSLLTAAGLKNFSGSVNLILNTSAPAGALVMSSGSVDQKNTYVFEVQTHAVETGAAKQLCFWSTGNGDDTMLTLWNAADEPQDLSFTLFYSGGQYVYPIHLGSRETRNLNVSDVLHSSIPDASGNVIPAGITEGSAEIAGSLGEQQQILVGLDSAVYNVRKATCGNVCWTCTGVTGGFITPAPVKVVKTANVTATFIENSATGSQFTESASWTSNNTAVATVGGGTGVVHGVAAGSFTLLAVDEFVKQETGTFCTDQGYNNCPNWFPNSSVGSTTQVPTYLYATGMSQTTNTCDIGGPPFAGVGGSGHYQVLAQDKSQIQVAGMTPQEQVTLNGTVHPFANFSTPVTTAANGLFDDTPIAACFPSLPPAGQDVCASPVQHFQIIFNGVTFPIQTVTTQLECYHGVRISATGNPTTPTNKNYSYTVGTP
jgi:hypothetical protein